jgi:hypothetical protein
MSYGSIRDVYQQADTYVTKILNGDKPADLPILQPKSREEETRNLSSQTGCLLERGLCD